jgi:hypothetical protein
MKMNKIILIAVCTLIFIFAPVTLKAQDEITINIDGREIFFLWGSPPAIVDGRILTPIDDVFFRAGFETEWDGENELRMTRFDTLIIITIGSESFTVDGISHELDVPAQIINNSFMLPLRAVLEAVGAEIEWDAEARTVNILLYNTAENISRELNETAEFYRSLGHNAYVREKIEAVDSQLLIANPGLFIFAFDIVVDGQIITIVDTDVFLYEGTDDIVDFNRQRTYYIRWYSDHRVSFALPYLEIDEEELRQFLELFKPELYIE